MDRNDTLRNLLIAGTVFMLMMALGQWLMPAPRVPPQAADGNGSRLDSQPGSSPGIGTSADAVDSATEQPESEWTIDQAEVVQTHVIGADLNGDTDPAASPYRMSLTVSNVGASIAHARLTDHAAQINAPERYELLRPVTSLDGSTARSMEVVKIHVDGRDIVLKDALWHVEAVDTPEAAGAPGSVDDGVAAAVRFRLDLHQAGVPALRLARSYRLPAQDRKSFRHDLYVDLTVENLSSHPHEVRLTYQGGLGLPQESPRMDDHVVDYGVLHGGERVVGTRQPAAQVSRDGGSTIKLFEPKGTDSGRFAWVATGNTYFSCTIAPLDEGGRINPNYVAAVYAIDVDPVNDRADDVTPQIITMGRKIEPGARASYPAEVYLGEKDPSGFRKVDEYQKRNYYFQIEAGFGWCTFGFLVRLMIWLLNGLHVVVRDYGIAIIAMVMIVRILLHPITKAGQVNMVRMQQKMGEFAPKLEEIKRKFGNDKARLQQETMKLYREHNVNPAGNLLGCLPLFIQMPIWIALYLSLSNNIHMRHEGFLFTWINDLTAQDQLIPFASPFVIPIVGWKIAAFNLLPPLVSFFMYIQQKSQPKPKPNPNMTDQQRAQQEMMQKMIPLMSIMMLVFFYNAPSGLNLYIMFSSLFGWIEQKRIRAHIKDREESGTLHKPAPKPDAERKKKRPGEMSFFEKIQKMAEDAQKAQAKRPTSKKGRR